MNSLRTLKSSILVISFVSMLGLILYPMNALGEVNLWAKTLPSEHQYPGAFRPNQDININWGYTYQDQLKDISINISGPKNKAWNSSIQLNDVKSGEHSPINQNYPIPGNNNPDGPYLIEITVHHLNGIKDDIVHVPFLVAKAIGNLTIIKFNDRNKNGVKDSDEEFLSGWSFKIGSEGASPQTYPDEEHPARTDNQGVIRIPNLPIGNYVIEENIQNSDWTSAP